MKTPAGQTGSIGRQMGRLRMGLGYLQSACSSLVFPPSCAVCEAELAFEEADRMLCRDCIEALSPVDDMFCRRCGSAVLSDKPLIKGCMACRGVRLRFDGVVPLGSYGNEQLRDALLRMKRPPGDGLSMAVGRLFCRHRVNFLEEFQPDLVTPVPMHWWKKLRRGTNSPEILARGLARQLHAPLESRMLIRRRNTLPQKDLVPKDRFRNVRGAFGLRSGYDLQDARVVVVDDILTTGATCSEVAGVLKKAGASQVIAAVMGRAVGTASS